MDSSVILPLTQVFSIIFSSITQPYIAVGFDVWGKKKSIKSALGQHWSARAQAGAFELVPAPALALGTSTSCSCKKDKGLRAACLLQCKVTFLTAIFLQL